MKKIPDPLINFLKQLSYFRFKIKFILKIEEKANIHPQLKYYRPSTFLHSKIKGKFMRQFTSTKHWMENFLKITLNNTEILNQSKTFVPATTILWTYQNTTWNSTRKVPSTEPWRHGTASQKNFDLMSQLPPLKTTTNLIIRREKG